MHKEIQMNMYSIINKMSSILSLATPQQSNHMTNVVMVLWVSLATLTWRLASSHPQCLDFLPPFELKDSTNTFCDGYASFGCCTKKHNIALAGKYRDITQKLYQNGLGHCSSYVKELLCQECSPYAAHIFDSETTLIKRPLAGMCAAYCTAFYQQCNDVVQYLTDDVMVLTSLADVSAFCGNNSLTDVQYCYPGI